VADAFDYIVKHADRADADAEWRISVTPAGKPPGRAGTDQRGIYLRKNGTHALNQFTVTAQPTFKQNETERAQTLQIGCSLSTTASWVSAPEFVWLGSKGRGFEVRVDTTGLAPGLHVAAVEGYDSESGLKLFECPVTIAKPTPPAPTVHFERVRLDHGKVERRFVSVPIGATWAEMRFRSSNHEKAGTSVRFWNHSVQMLPHARLNEVEKAFVMALNENEPVTKKVSVTGGVPMELCLAQFWASAAGFDLEVTIDWHGISFATPVRGRDETTLIGGEGIARIECTSHVRIEAFSPAISLEQRRSFARPTTSELRPLTSPRDALPDGSTLCELVLTYPLEIKEDSASIKYGLPLSNHLYDSAVPQLSAIFDAHKRRVHFSDVYSDAKAIDLSKGSYTVRVELLAAMPVLEKLRHMSLRVDTKLAKPVSLDVYEDHVDQYGAAKPAKFAGVKLLQGETKVLCLDTNIEGDALPKGVEAGDVLVGTMTASGNEAKGQLRLVVPPAIIKPKPDEGASGETPPTVAELMTGLVQKVPEKERDAYIDRLLKE
jgi:tripeptidyl-peptidase-2